MSRIRLADDLTLPPEAVTQTFAILANRGAGKTYTAAVLVEEILQLPAQVVVVDPVGVWWGLRVSADGQGAGYPVLILGGEHGDAPLPEAAGDAVAAFVVQKRVSIILDLSQMRKEPQRRFMTAFAERLYYANRDPLHLVLDEADLFAPQRPVRGQERLLGAMEDIVRRGRARGLGCTLITQRPASLNKEVLTQAETLIALRTASKWDRDAIDAWVRVHGSNEEREALMSSLASLPVGVAWIWSPGWLRTFRQVAIRRRETYDSSATPRVGEVLKGARAPAAMDLQGIREQLEAVLSAIGPTERRQRGTDGADSPAGQPGPARAVVERVEVPVLSQEQAAQLAVAAERIEAAGRELMELGQAILAALSRLEKNVSPSPVGTASQAQGSRQERKRQPEQVTTGRSLRDRSGLRAGERRMLEVLASRHPLALTRTQLGTLSGLAPRGGTFAAYFGHLRRLGLVTERPTGEVEITEEGLKTVGTGRPAAPQTPEEVQAMWRGVLRAGAARMLDVLVQAYPEALTRTELASRVGIEARGGTFSAYLSVLRRNGLAVVEGDRVRAGDALFLRPAVE